jgi:hypothetical protein
MGEVELKPDTVSRLLDMHERMRVAVRRNRPYPVKLRMGESDLDTVLNAAVELERARSA